VVWVPLGKDAPRYLLPIQVQAVVGGAVGVAVDQGPGAMAAEIGLHRLVIDVHDPFGLHGRGCPALPAVVGGEGSPAGEGLPKEQLLNQRIAHTSAKPLVGDVVGAQEVAVHEQGRGAVQVDAGRVAQQGASGLAGEGAPDQEVAIAVHQQAGGPGGGQGAQLGAHGGPRRAIVVVADPGIEQVSQDVEPLRRAGPGGQEAQKQFHRPRVVWG
jgi:hypothetical protein